MAPISIREPSIRRRRLTLAFSRKAAGGRKAIEASTKKSAPKVQ